LEALGHYIVDHKPDVVVQLGDFADMHSLSTYDRNTKKGENVRYDEDIAVATQAMALLLKPLFEYNTARRKNKEKLYKPRLVLTLGNHENRIDRFVNLNPFLDNVLTVKDLGYEYFGWEVYPFLQPIEIDGILYSHYFPRSSSGRIVQSRAGAPTAKAQVQREMQSCTSGHLQGLDYAVLQTGTRRIYGLIAGSFYQHDEDYLTPQGTHYWRGVIVKHEVDNGSYDPMFVSLNYLLKRYT
jgi:hypothetical protein